jgi:hypothetical protein
VIRRTAGIVVAEDGGVDPVAALAAKGSSPVTIDVDDDLPEYELPARRVPMGDRVGQGPA